MLKRRALNLCLPELLLNCCGRHSMWIQLDIQSRDSVYLWFWPSLSLSCFFWFIFTMIKLNFEESHFLVNLHSVLGSGSISLRKIAFHIFCFTFNEKFLLNSIFDVIFEPRLTCLRIFFFKIYLLVLSTALYVYL